MKLKKTLSILLVSITCLGFLSSCEIAIPAIVIPIYIQYIQGSRASDAQASIGAIYNAKKMYIQDYGDEPKSVEELVELGYLALDQETSQQWVFSFVGQNPITAIEAVSTGKMRGGAGHVILFDIQTGRFMGYGLPSD